MARREEVKQMAARQKEIEKHIRKRKPKQQRKQKSMQEQLKKLSRSISRLTARTEKILPNQHKGRCIFFLFEWACIFLWYH